MTNTPTWLPDLFPANPWNTNTYDQLYDVFCRSLKITRPVYRGHEVWFFPEMEDGREKVFWHLTTREDRASGERLPDLRRSERLPWVRPMLDQSNQPEILDWDHDEGDGTIKTYVWLRNFDFVVIMKKYPDGGRRLVTSFWIEYGNTRRKMQRKYDCRLA